MICGCIVGWKSQVNGKYSQFFLHSVEFGIQPDSIFLLMDDQRLHFHPAKHDPGQLGQPIYLKQRAPVLKVASEHKDSKLSNAKC